MPHLTVYTDVAFIFIELVNKNSFTGTITLTLNTLNTHVITKEIIVKINPHTVSYSKCDYPVDVGQRVTSTIYLKNIPYYSYVKKIVVTAIYIENHGSFIFNGEYIYKDIANASDGDTPRLINYVKSYTPEDLGKTNSFEYSDYIQMQSREYDGRQGCLHYKIVFYYE